MSRDTTIYKLRKYGVCIPVKLASDEWFTLVSVDNLLSNDNGYIIADLDEYNENLEQYDYDPNDNSLDYDIIAFKECKDRKEMFILALKDEIEWDWKASSMEG